MLIALLLAQAVATPACTATDTALPAPLSGWTERGAGLDSGKGVPMVAVDPASVRLVGVPLPVRAGKTFATALTVRSAGTYGIALDQKGWIDVYRTNGQSPAVVQASTAHGHGPACSTIAKIVRYKLAPGDYRVVVSGVERPQAKVMLVKGD